MQTLRDWQFSPFFQQQSDKSTLSGILRIHLIQISIQPLELRSILSMCQYIYFFLLGGHEENIRQSSHTLEVEKTKLPQVEWNQKSFNKKWCKRWFIILTCTYLYLRRHFTRGELSRHHQFCWPRLEVEAPQARRSCLSSLKTFTQSFLHRSCPKIRGVEIGSRSALVAVAHVCATCKAVWEGEVHWPAHLRDVLRHDQTSRAFFLRTMLVYL